MILLKKNDLSTEISAFTITTIFLYRSIIKRRQNCEERGFVKKKSKTTPKSVLQEGIEKTPTLLVMADCSKNVLVKLRPTPGRWLAGHQLSGEHGKNWPERHQNRFFWLTSVDKCLYIHRMRCGKTRYLSTRDFLSQTHPVWIQCLCKQFLGRQVVDFLDVNRLIHKKWRVYYHYYFYIYILFKTAIQHVAVDISACKAQKPPDNPENQRAGT